MKRILPILTLSLSGICYGAVPPEAINLSLHGTANCYIVEPGSTCYFDATKKGNSETEIINNISDVKLIWQSCESLVDKLEFDPSQGVVCAWSSGKEGNAVVGVIDEEGKVLWSWHLWITDYSSDGEYTTEPNASGKSWTFMSRNLGAITDKRGSFDNFGLLYQWGRKDPFPGPATFTVMNPDYTYEVDGEPVLYDIDNNKLPTIASKAAYHGSLELSINNPDVFYAMTYYHTGEYDEYGDEIVKNDYITGDWTDESNDDFWGGETQKKSIYDPSPVGYKVPVCDEDGNTPYDWLEYSLMKWDSVNKGAEQNGVWFPATGTRVYASGTLDFPSGGNPYSGLWIGTKGKVSSNLEEHPDLYGQYMFIINGKRTFKVSKDKRSQGMSVRCVRDEDYNVSGIHTSITDNAEKESSLYNLQGVCILKNANPKDLKNLVPGVYIYKSKKIIIK